MRINGSQIQSYNDVYEIQQQDHQQGDHDLFLYKEGNKMFNNVAEKFHYLAQLYTKYRIMDWNNVKYLPKKSVALYWTFPA